MCYVSNYSKNCSTSENSFKKVESFIKHLRREQFRDIVTEMDLFFGFWKTLKINLMKDQYFGDINDYRKYGLLRILSDNGNLRVGVCWMLTEPDGRTDGQFLKYLRNFGNYRSYDPELYDALLPCLIDPSKRNVAVAEAAKIIPNGSIIRGYLSDSKLERWNTSLGFSHP